TAKPSAWDDHSSASRLERTTSSVASCEISVLCPLTIFKAAPVALHSGPTTLGGGHCRCAPKSPRLFFRRGKVERRDHRGLGMDFGRETGTLQGRVPVTQ